MDDDTKFRIQIASTILSGKIGHINLHPDDPAIENYALVALHIADRLIALSTSNKNQEHA
jgi:hypothetical protein